MGACAGFVMASAVGAIRSATRRAVVSPKKFVAEHPSRAAKALVPASTAVAQHSGGHCDDGYVWGVTWPGHDINHQPNYDMEGVKKAFTRWKDFYIVHPDIMEVMKMSASSAITSKLP